MVACSRVGPVVTWGVRWVCPRCTCQCVCSAGCVSVRAGHLPEGCLGSDGSGLCRAECRGGEPSHVVHADSDGPGAVALPAGGCTAPGSEESGVLLAVEGDPHGSAWWREPPVVAGASLGWWRGHEGQPPTPTKGAGGGVGRPPAWGPVTRLCAVRPDCWACLLPRWFPVGVSVTHG